MVYLYILYSSKSDLFYVGISKNPRIRFEVHNSPDNEGFTKKHQPWTIEGVWSISQDMAEAMKIERFIKRQKSRQLINHLLSDAPLHGILSELERVRFEQL